MGVRGKNTLAGRDTPAKGPGKFKERLKEAAKDLPLENQGLTMAQQEKLLDTEAPEVPKAVRNGQMFVKFVRVKLDSDDDGRRLGLEISFPLTDEHNGMLPKQIKHALDFIKEGGAKLVRVTEIPPQSIELRMAPDMDETLLSKHGMTIESATVSLVEQTGEGKAEDVIRFSFTAWMELTKEALEFAAFNFDSNLWLSMERTQGNLLED